MSENQTPLRPNREFAVPASRERLEAVAEALRNNGIRAMVAADRDEAKRLVLAELPDGAHVHQGASVTLDTIGVTEEIGEGRTLRGRTAEALRPRPRDADGRDQASRSGARLHTR